MTLPPLQAAVSERVAEAAALRRAHAAAQEQGEVMVGGCWLQSGPAGARGLRAAAVCDTAGPGCLVHSFPMPLYRQHH
jgi:hypothetical protein